MGKSVLRIAALVAIAAFFPADAAFAGEQAVLNACIQDEGQTLGRDAAGRLCTCQINYLKQNLSGRDFKLLMDFMEITMSSNMSDSEKHDKMVALFSAHNIDGTAWISNIDPLFAKIDDVCKR